ncbi:hypothetical protein NMY22_g18338 [Coprinellus aureogranulatus]|nr:hypothetical protein NMY22_g18338 [Coprinellus aureogranulatus]
MGKRRVAGQHEEMVKRNPKVYFDPSAKIPSAHPRTPASTGLELFSIPFKSQSPAFQVWVGLYPVTNIKGPPSYQAWEARSWGKLVLGYYETRPPASGEIRLDEVNASSSAWLICQHPSFKLTFYSTTTTVHLAQGGNMIPSSSDTVLVDTLHLSACIGADCWGKTRAQPLFLSLYLDLEPRYLVASGEADEVEKSVHYGLLTKRVMGLVGGKGKDGESGGGWDGVEELVRGVAEEAFDLGGECVRSVRAVVRIPKFVLLAGLTPGSRAPLVVRAGTLQLSIALLEIVRFAQTCKMHYIREFLWVDGSMPHQRSAETTITESSAQLRILT